MCTLTIAPGQPHCFKLAFNRDERPTRPAALAPERNPSRFGPRLATFPTDPVSGGTWLAINDAGMAFAVLNVTRVVSDPSLPRRSRGLVIPALLHTDSPQDALAVAQRQHDLRDFAPFRLVVIGSKGIAELYWDGSEVRTAAVPLEGSPLLYTSSGLGDELVEGVRRELFHSFFSCAPHQWETAQEQFHRHSWPGREHLSVNMKRERARTVSYTRVAFTTTGATMTYHPAPPHEPAEDTTVHLPFSLEQANDP